MGFFLYVLVGVGFSVVAASVGGNPGRAFLLAFVGCSITYCIGLADMAIHLKRMIDKE